MRDWTVEYKNRGAVPFAVFPHHAFQIHTLVPNELAEHVLLDPSSIMSATYGVAFQMQFRQGRLPWSTRPSVFIIDRDGVLRYGDDYEDRTPLWTPLRLLDELDQQRSLIAALAEDPRFGMAARSALSPIGLDTAPSTRSLVEALKAESVEVRAGAAAALYWIAKSLDGGLAELSDSLNDSDARVRKYSALALGRRGKPAETHLVAALTHRDPEVRVTASRQISSYPNLAPAALAGLIAATQEKAARVRIAAVRSLVRLPLELRCTEPVLHALAGALTDSNERVRHDSAYGIQGFKKHVAPAVPTIAKALKHKDARVRLWGGIVLTSLGPDAEPAIPELIHNAIHDSGNPRNRSRDALGSIGTSANSALLKLLSSGSETERAGAAQVLGYNQPDDERVLPALITALEKDPSGTVRAEAASALGEFEARAISSTDRLTNALKDPNPKARLAAQSALAKIAEAAGIGNPAPTTAGEPIAGGEEIRPTAVLNPNDGVIRCVSFTPDGSRLAAGGNRLISLFDVASRRLVNQFAGHRSTVTQLSISAAGNLLASCSKDRTVRLWNLRTGEQLKLLPINKGDCCWNIAFSHDGETIAGASTHTIYLWNTRTGSLETTVSAGDQRQFTHLGFSPNRQRLAVGGQFGTVAVYDLANDRAPARSGLRLRYQVQHGDQQRVNFVRFSPDGEWLATAGDDNAARLWNAQTGGALLKLQTPGPAQSVAFSSDRSNLIAITRDESILVWSARGKLVGTAKGTDKSVRSMTVSPKGQLVATVGEDKAVKLWGLDQITLTGAAIIASSSSRRKEATGPIKPSADDLRRAREVVSSWDKNKDGELDVHEVLATPWDATAVKRWFPHDRDRDGRLTPEELAYRFATRDRDQAK